MHVSSLSAHIHHETRLRHRFRYILSIFKWFHERYCVYAWTRTSRSRTKRETPRTAIARRALKHMPRKDEPSIPSSPYTETVLREISLTPKRDLKLAIWRPDMHFSSQDIEQDMDGAGRDPLHLLPCTGSLDTAVPTRGKNVPRLVCATTQAQAVEPSSGRSVPRTKPRSTRWLMFARQCSITSQVLDGAGKLSRNLRR